MVSHLFGRTVALGCLIGLALTSTSQARMFAAPRGGFLSVGFDVGTRSLGGEASLVHLDRSGIWAGGVLGLAHDPQARRHQLVLAVEGGYGVIGAEAGLALRGNVSAARVRGLIALGPIVPYVDYLGFADGGAGIGVLLKAPIAL